MHEAVANRVRVGWVSDVLVPSLRVELAGDDGGARAVPILEHFEEVATLVVLDRRHGPVVDDEHVGTGELAEETRVCAVVAREGELAEKARGASVDCAVHLTTGHLRDSNWISRPPH